MRRDSREFSALIFQTIRNTPAACLPAQPNRRRSDDNCVLIWVIPPRIHRRRPPPTHQAPRPRSPQNSFAAVGVDVADFCACPPRLQDALPGFLPPAGAAAGSLCHDFRCHRSCSIPPRRLHPRPANPHLPYESRAVPNHRFLSTLRCLTRGNILPESTPQPPRASPLHPGHAPKETQSGTSKVAAKWQFEKYFRTTPHLENLAEPL